MTAHDPKFSSSSSNNETVEYAGEYKDPTLADLFKDMWRGRWFILTGIIFWTALAAGFVVKTPGYYRAEMNIGPVSGSLETVTPQAPVARDGQVVSPARFIQNYDTAKAPDQFARIEALLTGRAVAQALAQDPEISKIINKDGWTRPLPKAPLSADIIDAYLDRAIDISFVREKRFRKLTYHHIDRKAAGQFLETIFKAADNRVKFLDRQDIKSRIAHLKNALEQSANPDQRRALAFLLTLEEQKHMLLSSENGYAAKIIDPPSLSLRPVWPKLSLFVPGGILIGIIFGYIVFVIIKAYRE